MKHLNLHCCRVASKEIVCPIIVHIAFTLVSNHFFLSFNFDLLTVAELCCEILIRSHIMPPKRKRSKRASSKAKPKKLRTALTDDDNDDDAMDVEVPKSNEVHHPPYKSDATMMSLNDDCFYTIFKELTLSDLCNISQTCKRLHDVGSDYFMHRYKSKVLIIENVSPTGQLMKGPHGERYVDVFTKSSQNVTLGKHLSSKAALKRLVKFYKHNEMEPIKNLRFESWTRGLQENFGKIVVGVVEQVESFTLSNSKVKRNTHKILKTKTIEKNSKTFDLKFSFGNFKVVGDLHVGILQYLPNMKRFTFWKKDKVKVGNQMTYRWMETPYPKLKYFAWHSNSELPIGLANFFFDINPGIDFFSLQSQSRNTLQQLFQRNIRVHELFFTMTGNANIFADLQALCVQQGTRLHLKFPDGAARTMLTLNMPQFIQLRQYIDGLYFEKAGINESLAQTLSTFENLKVLQLNILSGVQTLTEIQTLQVVYAFWGVTSQGFRAYREAMMTYASRLRNLKRFYVRNNVKPFEIFKFDEFDAARSQLADACKLSFYFRTDELSYMGELNDIQREYDNIGIDRVETEEFRNPLVTEYLIGHIMKESSNRERGYSWW